VAEILTNENDGFLGKISIADEVIATIAGTAAMEIDGVAFMSAGNISGIAERLGKKNFSKGVRIEISEENEVSVELHLVAKSAYKLPEVSEKVQDRVKTAVETMTGLSVSQVNVYVSGLVTERTEGRRRPAQTDR